jgi:hypothetical protein
MKQEMKMKKRLASKVRKKWHTTSLQKGARQKKKLLTIRTNRAAKPNRPRHDAADEQLIIARRRPPLGVRINLNVLLSLAVRGVVGTLAELPIRLRRLRVGHVGVGAPGRPRCLDRLEVPVRVALDLLLGVGVLEVCGRRVHGCGCRNWAAR